MSSNVSVIIPCYNEAQRLDSDRFIKFATGNPRIHFVMVNDGSSDATLETLHQLKRRLPSRFAVVALTQNAGKAEAVRQGILHGFQRNPDYIGFWDADLATPLDAITEFVEVLDSRSDIDLVVGSRMPLLGRHIQRHFVRQKIGSVCSVMASLALGNRVRDTQCGAKLFRVTPVTRHVFAESLNSRWLFDVEFFARLIRTWKAINDQPFSRRVFEYPLQRWDEIPGSSLKKMDFVKATIELWNIYWRYLGPFSKKPDVSEITAKMDSNQKTLPPEKRAA